MTTKEESFTLSATPGNDIWRKPPNWDLFNAASRNLQIGRLDAFKSASICFDAKWEFEYDQTGLILQLESISGTQNPRWIKAGFEFFGNQPQISTVACDRFADWSVIPLSFVTDTKTIRILVERVEDIIGVSLWVYFVQEDGEKFPLREICWVYDEDGTGKDWNLRVGAYASRPDYRQTSEPLEAEVKELAATWTA
ncbi:hypothetical protein DER46DRAFT_645838 [Fusarium sp. MPI-SDFR-AT-0072]|nr:hypothetical protein DER46DRAFT_645838 [Fusarium sp. MPI-SDFR-AT-0072]KAI7769402.1 hypothetical protein LZL87_012843 [Fusarium oxysporum]